MKRIAVTAMLFLATVAGYAQWSNPADELPAYHPEAPTKGQKLPPVLAGDQLTGEYFRYPWQKKVYQEAAQVQRVIYQLPCFSAAATKHSATRVCTAALRVRTERFALPAPRKAHMPTG